MFLDVLCLVDTPVIYLLITKLWSTNAVLRMFARMFRFFRKTLNSLKLGVNILDWLSVLIKACLWFLNDSLHFARLLLATTFRRYWRFIIKPVLKIKRLCIWLNHYFSGIRQVAIAINRVYNSFWNIYSLRNTVTVDVYFRLVCASPGLLCYNIL